MVAKLVTNVDYTMWLRIEFNICFKGIMYVFQFVMYLISLGILYFMDKFLSLLLMYPPCFF